VRSGQDGECLPVSVLRQLDEVTIQPTVLLASIGDAFRLY